MTPPRGSYFLAGAGVGFLAALALARAALEYEAGLIIDAFGWRADYERWRAGK